MKHPCNKKCLKYSICVSKETIKCNLLSEYYQYLKKISIEKNENDLCYISVWLELKTKLPNIIGIRNAYNI